LVTSSEAGLGKAIRELRLERRMTMLDLTNATGLHYATLSRIEREKHVPRLETLCSLAAGLEVSVADVMRRADHVARTEGLDVSFH
jgi:transcriptional regulator with XRE-family HTH domain